MSIQLRHKVVEGRFGEGGSRERRIRGKEGAKEGMEGEKDWTRDEGRNWK